MDKTDVAIVGAGPNGLAIAAHLEAVGTERTVFGDPFATWRERMPRGMLLKSEPNGCDVAAPLPGYTLRDYCSRTGGDYAERGRPLGLETFVGYADWYARTLVPDVQRAVVTALSRTSGGFQLRTDQGQALTARRVVVATGLMPFAYVPAVLEALPSDLVSHTSSHSDLSGFRGRRVGVVGAGQSALETAALLHEAGADVEVITRAKALAFTEPNPEPAGWWSGLRRPVTALGEGWHCWFYHTLPDAFWALPEHVRAVKALTSFGPSGAWWLRPRLEGRVPVRTRSRVVEARPVGTRVRLVIDTGHCDEADYDHVIAGTGYRLDLGRLSYLSPDLRRELRVGEGAPVLSRSFESSAPGLFFVGSMAAPSLGPSMRFLSGTHLTARRLARRLRAQRRPAMVREGGLTRAGLPHPGNVMRGAA
jgi:lysine/ornithine N-monooxygenase